MRNVSDRRCRENQNTHFVFNNFVVVVVVAAAAAAAADAVVVVVVVVVSHAIYNVEKYRSS
jgi:hypothetical protein